MARGEMTHQEHQILVARWAVHNAGLHSEKGLQKMRSVAASYQGRKVKVFEFEAE